MLGVFLVCVVNFVAGFVNSVGNLRLMLWFVLLFSGSVCWMCLLVSSVWCLLCGFWVYCIRCVVVICGYFVYGWFAGLCGCGLL